MPEKREFGYFKPLHDLEKAEPKILISALTAKKISSNFSNLSILAHGLLFSMEAYHARTSKEAVEVVPLHQTISIFDLKPFP
ncbi:MAG: hypothetical protein ACOC6B_03605 [Thermodesulfobacteriota bacterium]